MDWSNERYVRLFVRDTTTWKLLPWQSRALLPLIMRKLDRSGVLDLGDDGEDGLAAVVEVPIEFLQAGLPGLLKRGVFRMGAGKLVMPNFMAAQEAKQSDAQRKRESRENQRLAAIRSQTVTDGHSLSESQPVTGCPGQSHDVTPDQTRTSPDPIPDQTRPDREILARVAQAVPANEDGKPTARNVLTVFGGIRARVCGGKATFWQPSENAVDKAAGWLRDMPMDGVPDIEPAINLACKHVLEGANGWTDGKLTDPNFLFGAFVARWSSLREELHGCAPKPKAVDGFGKPAARPRCTPVMER